MALLGIFNKQKRAILYGMGKKNNPAFIFFLLLTLSFTAAVPAQEYLLDSLKLELRTVNNDSLKMFLLTEICYQYINIDIEKAKGWCKRMLIEAEKTRYTFDKAEAFRIAANYYNDITDYENAFRYYKKAGDTYKLVNNRNGHMGYAKAKAGTGAIYHLRGDFNTALSYYFEAEAVLYKYKEYKPLMRTYSYIMDIYIENAQYEKAKAYDKKNEDILQFIDDPINLCDYYDKHAQILKLENKYGEAELYLKKGLKIAERSGFNNVLTVLQHNFAELLLLHGKYNESVSEFNKAAESAVKAGLLYDLSCALEGIGTAYLKMKDYKKANSYFLKALKQAEEIGSDLQRRSLFQSLAKLEQERLNYKQANYYLTKYTELSQAIYSEEDQKQVNFLNAKYETVRKENEINELKSEKRIHELENKNRLNIIYSLITLSLSLVIAIYFIQRYHKSRKKIIEQSNKIHEQKITELEKEKQISAIHYVLEGEEKERSRLARDLHDGLGGLLSGAKMAMSSFRQNCEIPDEKAASYKHAQDLLNKSISELQRVAHNMMPQALINAGLKDAVSEFCENIKDGSTVDIKFRFFGKDKKIQHKYEISIYRIIQELINNVLKHADATEALLQLVQDENRISIVVQDNGKGFDMDKIRSFNGHGLNNIKLRVESMGGHYEINSKPGAGTEVTIEFENIN